VTSRVLIDGHLLGTGGNGNEAYVRGLLSGLEELGRREFVAVSGPGIDVGAHQAVVLSSRSDVARLTVGLVTAAKEHDASVIHTTYACPLSSATASVVTVHDVSFLRHPEWFTLRDRAVLNAGVRGTVKRAARVLVPSGHARDELCALLGVAPQRVLVTPEGVDRRFTAASGAANGAPASAADTEVFLRRLGLRRPYVLALGNLQPRKNLERLVDAWALLVREGADAGHRLVVAGGFQGRRDDAPAHAIAAGIGDRVVFPGSIRQDDLPALYANADLFVFPSLYEGFGLPVLEAMACGAPVACSRTTSLPEVAGGAAALFDPEDPRDIAAVLGALIADPELRADLRARGRRRAGAATWRACAELTAAAYDAAASNGTATPGRRPSAVDLAAPADRYGCV
jgi:glycosyltransferase involved in cell wall biosynthesis